MSLILYGAPLSPFVRKIDAVLYENSAEPKRELFWDFGGLNLKNVAAIAGPELLPTARCE